MPEGCPSGLYKDCANGQFCTPVIRTIESTGVAKELIDLGFETTEFGDGDVCLRACTALSLPENRVKLKQVVSFMPDIDENGIRLSADTTGVILAADQARYETALSLSTDRG